MKSQVKETSKLNRKGTYYLAMLGIRVNMSFQPEETYEMLHKIQRRKNTSNFQKKNPELLNKTIKSTR